MNVTKLFRTEEQFLEQIRTRKITDMVGVEKFNSPVSYPCLITNEYCTRILNKWVWVFEFIYSEEIVTLLESAGYQVLLSGKIT